MTVVTSQWRWDAGVPWCSSASATTEPWYQLNTQLVAWVNGVNDANKISIVLNPAQNTTLNSATAVGWLLSMPETGTHLQFMQRPGNTSASGSTYPHNWLWGRTAGTGNNGMGTWTDSVQIVDSGITITQPSATVRQIFFTAYEFDVALPWFFIGYWPIDSLVSGVKGTLISRVDFSSAAIGANNPVPAGTSPWAILGHHSNLINIAQGADTRATIKGTTFTGITNFWQRDYDAAFCPYLPYGNTFTKPGIPWSFRYPVGKIADCLLAGSTGFGLPMETITYAGKTYMKLSSSAARVGYWLRID